MLPNDPNDPAELDLTEQEGAPTKIDIAPTVISRTPYDPSLMRETVRSRIAHGLIWLLAIVIVGAMLDFAFDTRTEELKDILSIILTPVVGIVGTVLGFYFGAELSKSK